jgi:hypothetical protein
MFVNIRLSLVNLQTNGKQRKRRTRTFCVEENVKAINKNMRMQQVRIIKRSESLEGRECVADERDLYHLSLVTPLSGIFRVQPRPILVGWGRIAVTGVEIYKDFC